MSQTASCIFSEYICTCALCCVGNTEGKCRWETPGLGTRTGWSLMWNILYSSGHLNLGRHTNKPCWPSLHWTQWHTNKTWCPNQPKMCSKWGVRTNACYCFFTNTVNIHWPKDQTRYYQLRMHPNWVSGLGIATYLTTFYLTERA